MRKPILTSCTFGSAGQSLDGSFDFIEPNDGVGFIFVLQQQLDTQERRHLENTFATGFNGRPFDRGSI